MRFRINRIEVPSLVTFSECFYSEVVAASSHVYVEVGLSVELLRVRDDT